MEFAAIDFETANARQHSACQLGAVLVRDGEIVERRCWYIRPRPLSFNPHHIRVHGITPQQVQHEADFAQLWDEIRETLGTRVLVAHNARFDLGVLRACLQFYELATPTLEFTCTRAIARRAWPGQPGYGLRALADRLGIVFRHHDALEDAEACARVLMAAARETRAASLGELEQRLDLSRGRAGEWGMGGPRVRGSRSGQRAGRGGRGAGRGMRSATRRSVAGWAGGGDRQPELDFEGAVREGTPGGNAPTAASLRRLVGSGRLERLGDLVAAQLPLRDQIVVFTGVLRQLGREQAEWLVRQAGGVVRSSVTRQTTLLVVGEPDERTLRAGRTKSTKQERAESLRASGQAIAVVDEATFLKEWLQCDSESAERVSPSAGVTETGAAGLASAEADVEIALGNPVKRAGGGDGQQPEESGERTVMVDGADRGLGHGE